MDRRRSEAAIKISGAWRSFKLKSSYRLYDYLSESADAWEAWRTYNEHKLNEPEPEPESESESEPVYDEQRRIIGYVEKREMEWIATNPSYAKWILAGPSDPLMKRLACERLGLN